MNKSILASVFVLVLSSCASGPAVYNIHDEFVPTLRNGEVLSLERVEKSIIIAAHRRGWSPRVIEPGLIEASIHIRSHRAAVQIPYSQGSYSIVYKNSEGLGYKNGRIHGNYNTWVIKLSSTIQKYLRSRR